MVFNNKTMYTDVKQIGQGSFGVVTLVKDSCGKFFAKKNVSDIIDILVGIRETDVLKRITGVHPYLINICDYSLHVEDTKYSIDQYLEYCSGGSLEELLDAEFKNPDRPIDPVLGGVRNRLLGLRNITESMVLLQNMGVYHMDMKTENILYRRRVDNKYEMCLCDFSNYFLDTLWKTNMEAPLVPQEAIMYRAPEIGLLRNSWEAHRKADVWALGVILMEIAGGWKTVQEIDSMVSVHTERIISLVDKIKVLQTNYIKRNGKRKNFKIPVKILLSNRVLPEELGKDFGKNISDESSLENQLLCSVFYAKQLCSPDIMKRACNESMEHFKIRKDTSDQDIIKGLYERILPRIFVTDVDKRISLQELYTLLSELLSKTPKTLPEQCNDIAEGGIWERIPDKVWRETVLEFQSYTSKCEISYGRKTISMPINHILFSKRIAEAALEKLIAGVDDVLSKDVTSRKKLYENILTASSFIASELLDFIIPYEQCTWFERHTLEDTAPFIKLVGDLLMGEIGQLLPNKEEMEYLSRMSSL
jgi:serine/threonine protein kinase